MGRVLGPRKRVSERRPGSLDVGSTVGPGDTEKRPLKRGRQQGPGCGVGKNQKREKNYLV